MLNMSPFEQRAEAARARIDDALGLRPAKGQPQMPAAPQQPGLAAAPPQMPPQAPQGGLSALGGMA